MSAPTEVYTVVYDGECRVCGRIVRVLKRWGRDQLEFVPAQDARVRARFPWIPEAAFAESLQLIGPGGRTWQRGAAIEQLLAVLPRGRLISWIFRIPFVRNLTDRLYRWFARHRHRLGCGEHCPYRAENTSHT
ncbi:MAG: thiol-disulfide oxidoreductase DCC family protein [Gemmatimonadota bacterium]